MSIVPRILAANGTAGGGGGVTYATWNSADKNALITLSNSDLKANSVNNVRSLRATQGKSSGKWYWECTPDIDGVSQSRIVFGAGSSSASLSLYVGGDANGWGYGSYDGYRYHSGTGTATGITAPAGAVIGLALNMDAGELKVYRASTGATIYTFTGLTGTIYPMCSGDFNAANVTANFGQSSFVMAVPSGFNSGVYT